MQTLCAAAVGNIAPTFLFASAMFNFVVLLHNLVSASQSGMLGPSQHDLNAQVNVMCRAAKQYHIAFLEQVSEKESGVRQVMSTMGLLTSPFWLTWALFEGKSSNPGLPFGLPLAVCGDPETISYQ